VVRVGRRRCAPTGMGKTLIAEAAVFEALHTRRRIYYTTPLIALTDQKYRGLQRLVERWGFSREDVGLITGNRRENPDALVRVVVAEILLNHLLGQDPALADLEHVGAVVMDEFHNFNDLERGILWELSLALLPPQVRVDRSYDGWRPSCSLRQLAYATAPYQLTSPIG
jgi:superfamily II RNA helicase